MCVFPLETEAPRNLLAWAAKRRGSSERLLLAPLGAHDTQLTRQRPFLGMMQPERMQPNPGGVLHVAPFASFSPFAGGTGLVCKQATPRQQTILVAQPGYFVESPGPGPARHSYV